jgi:16S rRNA (guanine(527)-N(7))-methyltransferase RsmG
VSITNRQRWLTFAQQAQLTPEQLSQFQTYYELLVAANELFNLTTITDLEGCIAYHFQDSLALGQFIPLATKHALADIGSGAGFPGIPLKIAYPHLAMLLIEVSHKKGAFLEEVCHTLGLSNIQVCALDWRTFLRKTAYPIELFCARASVQPSELLRMFKPSSPYNNAELAYWASATWVAEKEVLPFVYAEYPYKVGYRKRKLVILKKQP